ncbi:MAG: hypothetical protein V4612_03175 [Pseudomonadota bacterium]
MTNETKSANKSLIFLKASTIAMGLVFVVLLIALILIKQKKSSLQTSNCESFLQLKIAGEVDKIELQGNNIIILTKPNPKTKKQEIVKIDSNCTTIINRIELQQ